MGPAVKPPPRVKPAPQDEADVRAGFEEAENEAGRVLTPEELKHWAETGEWPDESD